MAVFQVEGRDALRILITERLAEVLQQADFVTLHFPRVQARQPCSSTRELRLLRPGAYLVSCAGGSLIDEAALLAPRAGPPGRGSARCLQPGTHRRRSRLAASPRPRARDCDPASGGFDRGGPGAGGDGDCQECRLGAARRHPHWRHPALVPAHCSSLAKRCLSSTVLPHSVSSSSSAFC